MKTLGQKLKELRNSVDLRQETLAEADGKGVEKHVVAPFTKFQFAIYSSYE